MSIALSRHVKARFERIGGMIAFRDLSIPMLITDQLSVLMTDGRYMSVSGSDEVGRNFGFDSEIYAASKMAFAHPQAPAKIMIGYWAKTAINQPESTNTLRSIVKPAMLVDFEGLFNFTIKSNEVEQTINVDFSNVDLKEYADIETAIVAAMGDDSKFVFKLEPATDILPVGFSVKSAVAGLDPQTQNIQIVDNFGRSFSNLTRLNAAYNPQVISGDGAITGKIESISKCLASITERTQDFYAVYVSCDMTANDLLELNEWVASSSDYDRIFGYTATKDSDLDYSASNPVYAISKMGANVMACQYNKTGQKHAVVQYLIEATSINFSGTSTARTMKFKEESLVQSDPNITSNVADKCDALGVNYYTDVRNRNMLAEGTQVGGMWTDLIVFQHAFLDTLEVSIFNHIANNNVPQTDEGQGTLLNVGIAVGEQFREAGYLAGGKWTGKNIGSLKTGDYIENGYYFYSKSFSAQLPADRVARKSMPVNVALKYSGFMHSADIILTLNQ